MVCSEGALGPTPEESKGRSQVIWVAPGAPRIQYDWIDFDLRN